MNKAEARRFVYGIVASQMEASMGDMLEQAGQSWDVLDAADQQRAREAFYDLVDELRQRSRGRVGSSA